MAPPTRTTAAPRPRRSYAIDVPSFDVTWLTGPSSSARVGVGCPWSPRADRDAVRVVLRGHQRGVRKAADADPEVEPSIGDHVDGRGDLREHGRQPNPVVRHQQPEPQPPRLRGQGGEQRPPLVRGPRRIADPPSVVGQQMVIQPCVLDLGDPVRLEPDPPDLVIADIGRRRLDAEARHSPSRQSCLHWSVLLIAPRVIGPRRASLIVQGPSAAGLVAHALGSCAGGTCPPLRAAASWFSLCWFSGDKGSWRKAGWTDGCRSRRVVARIASQQLWHRCRPGVGHGTGGAHTARCLPAPAPPGGGAAAGAARPPRGGGPPPAAPAGGPRAGGGGG